MYIYFKYRKDPKYASQVKVTWRERWVALRKSILVLAMPVIVLGGIYGGIFTPTEAAAVAVLYAFLLYLGSLKFRKFTLSNIVAVSTEAASKTSMVLMIIAGSVALGSVFTILQVTQQLMQFVVSGAVPPWLIIATVILFGLLAGCFIDGSAIILILVPIVFLPIMAMGYDSVWFGVAFCQTMEIGLVTPPVGLNLYAVQAISGYKLETVYRGVLPFLLLLLLGLTISLFFEPIITWLPSMMVRG